MTQLLRACLLARTKKEQQLFPITHVHALLARTKPSDSCLLGRCDLQVADTAGKHVSSNMISLSVQNKTEHRRERCTIDYKQLERRCIWPNILFQHNHCATVPGVCEGDKEEQQLEFRIIDYGHARLAKNKALAKLPRAPGLEKSYRK